MSVAASNLGNGPGRVAVVIEDDEDIRHLLETVLT